MAKVKKTPKSGKKPEKRPARIAQDATAKGQQGQGIGDSGVKVKAGTSREATQERREKFVEAYIANGGNATQAAIAAGFSEKTADQQGSRLLKDVKVKRAVEARREQLRAKYRLTTENVLQEVARISFFDPRALIDEKGNLKQLNMLDEDTARAIASVEVTEEFTGRGEARESIGFTKKVRVFDKNAALDKAMKHLGLLKATVEHTGPGGGPIGMAMLPATDYNKVREALAKHEKSHPG